MGAGFNWFEKLRHSSGVEEAAVVLSHALGETAGASVCGVFLLNDAHDKLVLFSRWSEGSSATEFEKQPVSSSDLSDPLCLALHKTCPMHTEMTVGMKAPPSLQLLRGQGIISDSQLVAFPLRAFGDSLIGAALACGRNLLEQAGKGCQSICEYAAMTISFMLHTRNYNASLSLLRDDISRMQISQSVRSENIANTIVGISAEIQKIREKVHQVAEMEFPVMITGETGTGKEVVASAIHTSSPRAGAPFVKINCAALPEHLLESELFGHKKGAFSGASSHHDGLFRSADNGTILLDEVGEMPAILQAKLLRVLQEYEVRPVGDVNTYPVNVRILSSTNKDIEEAIASGSFRADLYYRLSGVRIHLPPLRERVADIPSLAEYFVKQLCENSGKNVMLSMDALNALSARPFPGNVREIKSYITYAFSRLNEGCVITSELFPFSDNSEQGSPPSLPDLLDIYERGIIRSVLARNGGNIDQTAKALGIPRSTLRSKLKKIGDTSSCVAEATK